jgi:hypothetical protein
MRIDIISTSNGHQTDNGFKVIFYGRSLLLPYPEIASSFERKA